MNRRLRLATCLLCTGALHSAELRIEVTDETGTPMWSRIEVRGADGRMPQPASALVDKTARNREGGQAYYLGSFVVRGQCELTVPPGDYLVVAEHGPEYERFVQRVTVGPDETRELAIRLAPWIRMRELNWWSGDMHVHRPVEEAPSLALAEDLNLSVVFTMWNRRNLWSERPPPDDPVIRASTYHLVTVMNAEDERGGGAWMLHHLPEPIDLAVDGRWYPAGLKFIREVREAKGTGDLFPWVDLEKPIWWETPIVMALEPPNSLGTLHNHFNQYGIYASEAWGRPRDADEFSGQEGFVSYSLGLYYRYLNLGFRLPPSAGSASGVLPNPVGYNRIYARVDGPFSVESWYQAVREGRVFVTNGPMLFVNLSKSGDSYLLSVDARSREPLDRIEIVANGKVVRTFNPPAGAKEFRGSAEFSRRNFSWVAARCFAKSPETIRLAHSAPVYLDADWDGSADARYFLAWIDELIALTQSETDRFASDVERDAILALYREAREFYERKVR